MLASAAAIVEMAASLATAAGIGLAATQMVIESRRTRRERDERVFTEINDAYLQYLALVISNPHLSAFEVEASAEVRSDLALWETLFTVAERAYVLYGGSTDSAQDDGFRGRQWAGWEQWLERWAERPDFREAWLTLRGGEENDSGFGSYVERLVQEQASAASTPQPES